MAALSTQPLPDYKSYASQLARAAKEELGVGEDSEYIRNALQYAENLLCRQLPVIFSPQHLCQLVGYSSKYVMGAAYDSDSHYRSFAIKKSDGSLRQLAEPLPSLKEIQNWIYREILLRVPVSPAAKAYKPGLSLRDSARFHMEQRFVLRMDIENFFPSITRKRVFGLLRSFGYSSSVAGIISRLCCLNDAIPQGGVCSPYLSNLILRAADARVLKFCQSRSLRYTRYADDFAISGRAFCPSIVRFVEGVISSEGFKVNPKKTMIMRAGSRQTVVGVVVNAKKNAPREFRRSIRKTAHFVAKFGIDDHLAHTKETRSGSRNHYLGKCGFVLELNPNDRDARRLRELLGSEQHEQS